jgi:histidinol dehydrogenase
MQVVDKERFFSRGFNRFLSPEEERDLARKVMRIVHDVRLKGDLALRKYTREFDGVDIPAKRLRVTEGDINRAYEKINRPFIPLLKQVQENAIPYYEKEIPKNYRIDLKDNAYLEKRYSPLDRIGIYIPGGTAPLISTVYMTALPAKVAGVKEIVMCSPPHRDSGDINPHILTMANLLGVKEIYRIGGAQAIAAMAFGTKTVNKVDKIVGPGNQYVTEAKRQVYGYVDIDMVAGPSEIVVIADDSSDPNLVTCDLLSQAEHYNGIGILVTPSKKLTEALKKRVETGYIILVKDMDEACEVTNQIAPEHLEIMTKKPELLVKKIRHAGAIFLGPYSPVVAGDYVAGPSHVLPTGGTAKYFSPLSATSFIKHSQVISLSREALEKYRENLKKIASLEGLYLHQISAEARFQEHGKPIEVENEKK